jgi:predicted CXXCH cytochrome family protein
MNKLPIPFFARAFFLALIAVVPAGAASQRGVYYSPHNFSASRSAGSPEYGSTEERLCVFCHTPHHAGPEGPLWSRDVPDQDYQMYTSPTMTATLSPKPTGASRLCLSCHDGTIAVGTLAGGYVLTSAPAVTGRTLIGQYHDLSADHPISFTYPVRSGLAAPSALPPAIKLGPGNTVECTACHDPHDNEYGNFLVMNDPDGARLCTSCHLIPGWVTTPLSIHKTGIMTNNQGCGNCHQSHKNPGAQELLKYGPEEKNCTLACHAEVAPEFASPFIHPVSANNGIHRENEIIPAVLAHVKCVDCHNPHQATNLAAPPQPPSSPIPRTVNGPLAGMRGIDSGGSPADPAQYEYQVCFRCHSGAATASNFVGPSGAYPLRPTRLLGTVNERDRFAITNSSFHPVIGQTNQPLTSFAVKSLISPVTGTFVYCTDCHKPHGSLYPQLLTAKYDTFSEPYVSFNSELCYRCHNEAFILNSTLSGFPVHSAHVNPTQIGRPPVPCSGCHDPHGVGTVPHLINFDTALLPVAADLPFAAQTYLSTGPGQGRCTVSCHSTGSPNKYTHSYP